MIGITQEQHPDRCRLFAQWQQLDFPILWDPFNLTDSKVVPNFIAIDEHGIVRSTKAKLESFEADFLDVEFPAPAEIGPQSFVDGACSCPGGHHFTSPIGFLTSGERYDESVAELERLANEFPDRARPAFRAGVAFRLRYDSKDHQPNDFQAALDYWNKALALEPNQYIWRRRIQQYGPRMDKPYPFYSWVADARVAITERGETPIPLIADLTGAELAEPRRDESKTDESPTDPDAEGRITRDQRALVAIETAVAFDTSKEGVEASIHVSLRPNALLDSHWNHEAGSAVVVWIGGEEPALLAFAVRDDVASSSEVVRLNVDRHFPPGTAKLRLPAYALYYVCEGIDGKCLYLRQDFEVAVERP